MAKKIVTPVEVQASVKGDESVKSFRAQLKEAQQEAFRLAQALGQTSPEAVKAAQKVAELKDQMDDYNATVASVHPDKFEAIAKTVGTLANGFAAAQGAAALLGSESEDLQKAMVRVQGAMALAQGIAGLKDMQFMLVGIRTAIMTQVIPAFSSLSGALMATGIGAIIVAIGAALAIFADKVSNARKAGEQYREELKRMEAAQEELRKTLESNIQGVDIGDEIQLLRQRLSGQIKTEEEFEIKRVEMLQKTYQRMADQHKAGSDERLAYLNASVSAGLKLEKLRLEQQIKQEEEAEEKRKARREKAEADAKQKAADDERKKKEQQLKDEASRRELQERDEKVRQDFLNAERQQEEERLAEEKRMQDVRDQIAKGYAAAEEVRHKRLMDRLKAEEDFKKSIEQNAIASAQALISIIGEQTAAGKAIALAQIAYDTGKAISAALAVTQSPSADNVATGGLAGIAKYAAISAAILSNSARAIRIVKSGNVQQGGGGGSLNVSGNIPQPSFTSSTLGGGTQFAGSVDNKVYVTEGDITGTQRRVRQNRGVSVI